MDFPKSVPGIGLVNDRFVDENPSTGQIGSLIPAAWMNAVTLEMTGLVRRAGLEPDEARNDQLGQAVDELIAAKIDGKLVRALSQGRQLTGEDMGLLLLDASAAAGTYTLPASIAELGIRDVIVRRTDNTGNRLVVQVSGNDRIKFHTHLRVEGYPFLVLMGAGDFWHLRSDGAGNWWPVARRDDAPLGSYRDTAGAIIPPGGYGLPTGTVHAVDYPWLADYAQQSGALVAVGSRTAKDGRWSITGDGTTIYLPSPGAAFRRPHDPAGTRELGSYQGDAIRNITASWEGPITGAPPRSTSGAASITDTRTANAGNAGQDWQRTTLGFDASSVVPTADENRPANVTAYPLIKLV